MQKSIFWNILPQDMMSNDPAPKQS